MEELKKQETKYTPEQRTAIEKVGNNILVSAGAGSGKTSVLVERMIYKVLYAKDKTNIDELLVVTFTNAAALEMKERILNRIESELELNPEDKFLQEQIIRINKAQISTIDSFCLKVVKENFKIIDIEPNFRIGETSEINLIKDEALEEFLEKYYEDGEEWFYDLLDAFSSKYDDTSFKEIFWQIYEQAQNSPYPNLWLKDSYNEYEINNEKDFFSSKIFEKLIEFSKETLNLCLNIKQRIMDLLNGKDEDESTLIEFLNKDYIYKNKTKKTEEEREGEFLQIERAYDYLNNNEFERFYNKIKDITFFRIKSAKDKEIKDEIRNLMEKNRELIKDLQKKFFDKDINTIILESQMIYKIIKDFCNLIIEFDKYYLEIKKKKNIYTFNDISHFCLEILLDTEINNLNGINEYYINKKPSLIAQNYANFFKEIITDEYQDTNLIQEEIFSLITNGKNRFMVGDIKQCIYRFRQANTNIFNEKYLSYKNDILKGERIDLNANFRSTKNIIDSINIIFERLMSYGLGEVDYNEEAKLKKITIDDEIPNNINVAKNCDLYILDTTDYIQKESVKEKNEENDLTLFDNLLEDLEQDSITLEDLKDMEIEAHFIAKKIKDLIEKEKLNINKGEKYSLLEYKDIVILTRNNQFAPIVSKVLDEYEIPVFSTNKNNFYEVLEIDTILNVLRIIDNPLQDIPLISVLYSSMFDFNANELLEIKIKGKNKYYYNCLLNYLDEFDIKEELKNKIKDFLDKIEQWKNLSKVLSINELLSYIYKTSNYYNYVGLLKNGKIRQANLFNLLEKSISFETNNSHNIFEFINYIEKLKNNVSKDDRDINIFSENENVVRVMTIHKSKGLEFPVVFVSNLSKKFNMLDTTNKISFDSEFKLGASIIFNKNKENVFSKRFKINSIQKRVINEKIKRDTYSEELRILYVALTRAKEKLILTGCVNAKGDNIEKKQENFKENLDNLKESVIVNNITKNCIYSPLLFTLKSPTYLSWIYSVLSSYVYNENWKIDIVRKEDIFESHLKQNTKKENIKVNFKELIDLDKNKKYSEEYDKIIKSLNWEYSFEYEKMLDSNLTVSEIKRQDENIIFKEDDENNLFLEEFDEATYNFPKFYTDKEETISPLVKGTLYHIILDHLDLNLKTIEEVDSYFDNLEKSGVITAESKNILDKNLILMFLKSKLANRMRKAKKLFKEKPFKLGLNPNEIYENIKYEGSSVVIVNGIIDLFFEEDGEIVLVDYKTDKSYSPKIIKERYKLQVEIYKKAIERATNKKVKECILYLILYGKEIRV